MLTRSRGWGGVSGAGRPHARQVEMVTPRRPACYCCLPLPGGWADTLGKHHPPRQLDTGFPLDAN